MSINYADKIPNNVDLGEDRQLQRALEHWQPKYLDWWQEMGPEGFQTQDVYLRTAVSVDPKGWGTVRLCEDAGIPLGHFSDSPGGTGPGQFRRPQGRQGLAGGAGRIPLHSPPDHYRAGRHRARLGRTAAVPGRHLPVALRPAQPVPGECRGRPAPVGNGLPAAEILRPRRPRGGRGAAGTPFGRREPSADPGRVQRAHARLAVFLLLHLHHGQGRQVPARGARRVGFRPAGAHLQVHADGGGPPSVCR